MRGIFESLQHKFECMSKDINDLVNDIEAMQNAKKTKTVASRRTIEPMTRLRKDSLELQQAKDNPDEQFIKDRISDIFGI